MNKDIVFENFQKIKCDASDKKIIILILFLEEFLQVFCKCFTKHKYCTVTVNIQRKH